MSIYKITLEPMGAFFFGGERSFSISTKDKNGNPIDPQDQWDSYIVESNKYPQQTSLLGMLRFTLLKNNACFSLSENKITDDGKDAAKTLIGATGFKVNNDGSENSYGVIKSISTCYIDHKGKLLIPTPLDYGLEVDFSTTTTATYNNSRMTIPYINSEKKKDEQYSGKTERKSGLLYLEGGKLVSYDKVFVKDQRVGINRDIKTGKTDNNALFKQVFYRLKDGCKFCFYATITEESAIPTSKTIVELGGDSSKFAITFTKLKEGETEPEKFDEVIKSSNKPSVVLLADTYVETANYIFAISETVPFTFLVSSIDNTTQYSRMPRTKKNCKSPDYLHKSDRYSLFKRGSVFYFDCIDKAQNFKINIEGEKCFVQIGYNKCKVK